MKAVLVDSWEAVQHGGSRGAIQCGSRSWGQPMVMVTLRDHDHSAWGNRSGGTTGSAAGVATQETVACVEHSGAAVGMEPSRSNVEPSRSVVDHLRSSSRSGVEH